MSTNAPSRTVLIDAPGRRRMHHANLPQSLAAPPPVAQHTLFALTARGAMLAARGLALIMISRKLGTEPFGVYALVLVTYNLAVSLSSLGLDQTNLYLAGRRPTRVPVLVGNSLLVAAVAGSAAGILLWVLVETLRANIFTGTPPDTVLLTAFAVPIAVAHSGLVGVVIGLGRFRYYGGVEAAKWSIYLSIVGFLYSRDELNVTGALGSYYAALLFAVLTHTMFLGIHARTPPRPRIRVLWRMLTIGGRMLLIHLSRVLLMRMDIYAVRLLGSLRILGPYALASQLSELVLHVARSFALVVFSGTARGNSASALRVGTLTKLLVAAAIVLPAAAFLTRQEVLAFLFGETAIGSGSILLLRVPGALAAALTLLFAGELLGRGRIRTVWHGNVLGVAVLVISVTLLSGWSVQYGAALAFSAAAVVELVWIGAARRNRCGPHRERARFDLRLGIAQRSSRGTGFARKRLPEKHTGSQRVSIARDGAWMRIGILTSAHPPLDPRIYFKQARALRRAGHVVHLVARAGGEIEDVHYETVPVPRFRLARVRTIVQVLRRARQLRCDVYHIHDPELLPGSVILKWLTRARLVYDVHENVRAQIRTKPWIPSWLRDPIALIYGFVERICLTWVDHIVLAEDSYTQEYRGTKVSIVRNFPILSADPEGVARQYTRRPLLVYCGAVARARGAIKMIEAVALLRERFPEVQLRIIGQSFPAALEGEMQRLVKSEGLEDHVHILGRLPMDAALREVRVCDIGLALLHPDPNYLESIPTKMFEYMWLRLPVVVSNFPMWCSIVDNAHCGLAVDPLSAPDIANAIAALCQPGVLESAGENGRAAVRGQYTWASEEGKLAAIYERFAETSQAVASEIHVHDTGRLDSVPQPNNRTAPEAAATEPSSVG